MLEAAAVNVRSLPRSMRSLIVCRWGTEAAAPGESKTHAPARNLDTVLGGSRNF